MQLLKYFKQFSYYINLTPAQTIERIKSKTYTSSRSIRYNNIFRGVFKDNMFKICFMSSGNIWIHDSFNPIFIGYAEKQDYCTKLVIKMKPNVGMYLILVWASIFLLFDLICLILALNVDIPFYIVTLIMSLGFISMFFFGTAIAKYKNMRTTIEELFSDKIMN